MSDVKETTEFQDKCEAVAALYMEAADTGRGFQYQSCDEWISCDSGPDLDDYIHYRVKPVKPFTDKLRHSESGREVRVIELTCEVVAALSDAGVEYDTV